MSIIYIVITYPLKPRMTRGTTSILLVIIWLVSTTVTVPVAVHSELYTVRLLDGTVIVQCAENWKNGYAMKAYTLLMVCAEFLVPLVAMCVAYYLIAKTLWFREIPGGHNTEEQEQVAENSKRRTIRMLIIVVALFALCWAPYHGFAITRDVVIPASMSENFALYHTLFYVVEALAMSNSIFNTLVYIVFNANFRKCVMQMKFPRTFHHVMRHSSMKTRSSWPTSNFRMGTYQRSTGPDKSFGMSSPSRSPVTRRPVQAKCVENDLRNLLTNTCQGLEMICSLPE
ncbi:prokineticin receptor 2-like [Patiria miniata]|uniref:G-protein coupled receptors family 1 profile domain-containing protein n=1 Tax=Patiria miniata TaxID=46514 RepID=A0A913Z4P7_PATMI|nr:prokineticin receptor 2-like [Patiria miniata]